MRETALLIFLSFSISLVLIVTEIKIKDYQQIVSIILVFLVLIFSLYFGKNHTFKESIIVKNFGVFFSCLLVFLFVLSSGSFNSPLLILIHLYILGLAFTYGVNMAVFFMILAIALLSLNIVYSPIANYFFFKDPYSVILYAISFFATVPISFYLSKNYQLKSFLVQLLNKKLSEKELQQQSILRTVDELILITDTKLNIISASIAVEKKLNISQVDIINHNLFNIFYLKDRTGKLLNSVSLDLANIIVSKQPLLLNDVILLMQNRSSITVDLNINPIVNLDNKVEELTFVISVRQSLSSSQTRILDNSWEKPQLRYSAALGLIRQEILNSGSNNLKRRIEMVDRIVNDMLLLQKINNKKILVNWRRRDVSSLCKKVLEANKYYAELFDCKLNLRFSEFSWNSMKMMILPGVNYSPDAVSSVFFTIETDAELFSVIINKLVNLAILTNSNMEKSEVEIILDHQNPEYLEIQIKNSGCILENSELGLILESTYRGFENETRLSFGSGLEGNIAKKIASLLGIKLITEIEKIDQISKLSFKLIIRKQDILSNRF